MGGDPNDSNSFIAGSKLVDIIKNKFGLTIDIKKMIAEVDEVGQAHQNGNDELELDELSQLLDPKKDDGKKRDEGSRGLRR